MTANTRPITLILLKNIYSRAEHGTRNYTQSRRRSARKRTAYRRNKLNIFVFCRHIRIVREFDCRNAVFLRF